MALLDNEKIAERLKSKRLAEPGEPTSRKFAMAAGIDPSQYTKIEKAQLPITEKILDKLIAQYGYDRDYILYGTNVPEASNQGNTATEKNYLASRLEKKNSYGPLMVPLVPIAAHAGYAKNFYDLAYIEKLETYPILPGVDPHGAIWRYFQVKGKSMEDTLLDKQFILASQVNKEDWINVETSYIYVVVTDDGLVVKRLYKVKGKDYWAAVSDNADEKLYPQFRVYVSEVKELWKFRRKVDWHAPAPRKVEIKV